MLLNKDPFGFRKELELFKESLKPYNLSDNVKQSFYSSYKRLVLIEFLITSNPEISHKKFLKSIIYDVLNSIVSIINNRERYFQLNIRSMVEHLARISLQKIDHGEHFDITIRLENFEYLKENKKDENWSYLHQQYTQACSWLHSSSKVNLNINYTFNELLSSDIKTTSKRMASHLNTLTNEIIRALFCYYYNEIGNIFLRNSKELKYLITPSGFEYFSKKYQK